MLVANRIKERSMKRKGILKIVTGILAVLAYATVLQASIDRGVIQGTISDEQGAVVPGAKVVVRNVETNIDTSLAANSQGFYLAPELVPGKYSVHIEAGGFSPMDITNVT